MTQNNKTAIWQIFLTFLILGLTSFGGPIAHIGYFHQTFIKQKKWLTEAEFSQLLAVCQFIPGPASSQLGFAIGFARAGMLGGLAAFIGFTLPSVLVLVGFVSLLPMLSSELGSALIHGLKLVAVVIVADAVLGMANKLCSGTKRRLIALVAAVILLLIPSTYTQVGMVLLGALFGIWLFKSETKTQQSSIQLAISARSGKVCLLLFSILLLAALFPYKHVIAQTLANLYQAGAMVFGGGHVVLPYLEQSFVGQGLIDKETFLAGYGATQAVPGPLFTFASYISAVLPTPLPIWQMVTLGTLAVFLPGFLLLFAALPAWQKVANNGLAKAAIAGVNAAVVGILAASFYNPILTSSILSLTDLGITIIGFALIRIWHKPPILVVAWALLASIALVV